MNLLLWIIKLPQRALEDLKALYKMILSIPQWKEARPLIKKLIKDGKVSIESSTPDEGCYARTTLQQDGDVVTVFRRCFLDNEEKKKLHFNRLNRVVKQLEILPNIPKSLSALGAISATTTQGLLMARDHQLDVSWYQDGWSKFGLVGFFLPLLGRIIAPHLMHLLLKGYAKRATPLPKPG